MCYSTPMLFGLLVAALLQASNCGREKLSGFPEPEIAEWDSLPSGELHRLWQEAQQSAGVLAVEPYTTLVGSRAAKKKTWAVADGALKFFVYGYEPIWFPADVVRRTVCGSDSRWSYFWHGLSGDESDLHPWFDGSKGFRDLLGEAGSALNGVVDAAECREVHGGAGTEACLYGEVSPPAGFDAWFCGGRGATCRRQVNSTHTSAPAGFASPQTLCMHGPFVLERVHGWRPEIHPAEVLWARGAADRDTWLLALVPDTSERFDEPGDYDGGAPRSSDPWRPWSSERPIELWVAISQDERAPRVFDLSRKVLGKARLPARQATLTPPAPGAFEVLTTGLEGVLVASKTWPAGDAKRNGFLVVRTTLRRRETQAVVLRLTGRGTEESPPDPEIEGTTPAPALGEPEAETVARVRMLGETRPQPAVVGTVSINTLVRFDPRRPSVPADEEATDRLNEALKGDPSERSAQFGKERPFRVEWDLTATRDSSGQRVPVEKAPPSRFVGTPPSDRVLVAAFPGPATEEIRLRADVAPPELETAERKPVSLGQLLLSVPSDVTVRGEGRVFYVGSSPLGLPEPAVALTLRFPGWSFKDEWDLVSDVLAELDAATAPRRLTELREAACAPAPSAECAEEPLAPAVAKRRLDPLDRWQARRELESGPRPFARFVRLFARDLRWDGRVSNDERDLLKRLLEKASLAPD
jgi:hypothetical protein